MSFARVFAHRASKRDTRQGHLNSLPSNPPAPTSRDTRAANQREGASERVQAEVLPPPPPARAARIEKRPASREADQRPSRRQRSEVPEVEIITPEAGVSTPGLEPNTSVAVPPSALPPASPSLTATNSAVVEVSSEQPPRGSQRTGSCLWLHSSFRMPTERAELPQLSHDIAASAAPLNNIDFTDPTAAAVIGLTVVRRGADMGTYRNAKKAGFEEVANRGGAFLAQVSITFLFKL